MLLLYLYTSLTDDKKFAQGAQSHLGHNLANYYDANFTNHWEQKSPSRCYSIIKTALLLIGDYRSGGAPHLLSFPSKLTHKSDYPNYGGWD